MNNLELLKCLQYLTEIIKDQEKHLQRIDCKLVAVNMKAGLVELLGGFLSALAAFIIYLLLRIAP